MKTPTIRFRIDFAENANLGPGKIELLEGIRESGSLSEAARLLGMSYRRAWLLLDSLNKSFDRPSTINTTGGARGGGAKLTPFGLLLINRYRRLERRLRSVAEDILADILPSVRTPKATKGVARKKLQKKSVATGKSHDT